MYPLPANRQIGAIKSYFTYDNEQPQLRVIYMSQQKKMAMNTWWMLLRSYLDTTGLGFVLSKDSRCKMVVKRLLLDPEFFFNFMVHGSVFLVKSSPHPRTIVKIGQKIM